VRAERSVPSANFSNLIFQLYLPSLDLNPSQQQCITHVLRDNYSTQSRFTPNLSTDTMRFDIAV